MKEENTTTFTREELLQEAAKYTTLQALLKKLDPNNTGWKLAIGVNKGASVTVYKNFNGEPVKTIYINNQQQIKTGVLDLAWEITNALNANRIHINQQKARIGTVTELEYVLEINKTEAEAQYNKMKTAEEMREDLTTLFDAVSIELYKAVDAASKLSGFINGVAKLHFDKGTIDTGDGKGKRLARVVYAEQYNRFKQLGV